jgi:hypothetical protein
VAFETEEDGSIRKTDLALQSEEVECCSVDSSSGAFHPHMLIAVALGRFESLDWVIGKLDSPSASASFGFCSSFCHKIRGFESSRLYISA